ncbi:GNAT family N-acetyltransferase [Paenibacillus polysaccharolyticus]|uniref:MSMEG_0567/Sll0786 family nitrogen starvation N-acetyltransferase n=1 Tax=Paenibacillus polysaccharolyticus TaxID=582692 RepID=UPI0020A0462D|nr:MSMEG_0567/Sll0786 family nitrogen starvation N-acetyltransferase [Paenibacillus polysaccharolyticus]MCP1136238.1 GNAT family N-acetyltransferase [Paenibacillus polysaccharolyticus]
MRNCKVKLAVTEQEIQKALSLRRQVFVEEQHLFDATDEDEHDEDSFFINAWKTESILMGTVRCYPDQEDPFVWWGGRLAVRAEYRLRGIGVYLIEAAVEEMKLRRVRRFLAQVQQQNVKLFEKLGWVTVGDVFWVCDHPHQIMEANLHVYDAPNRKRRQRLVQD